MNSRLEFLKDKIDKKPKKPSGIDAYIMEESEGSNDSFEEAQGEFNAASLQDKEQDVTKLLDIELIKLLKYCHQLGEGRENDDDYQDDLVMKGFELGKKTKDKLLIWDMDETLIAAKF